MADERTDEERMYEAAKADFRGAQNDLRQAKNDLQLWKDNHAEQGYGPLDAELIQLQKNVEVANQLLNDAERRFNARAAAITSQQSAAGAALDGSTKRIRFTKETFSDVPLIDLSQDYVTLSKIYLEKAGCSGQQDMILYTRPAFRKQVRFLRKKVMKKNVRGFIVGPPGTGKSVCTLAFMGSLDRDEWQVIWIHMGKVASCFILKPNEYWFGVNYDDLILPDNGRKRFVCLDGYKSKDLHDLFFIRLMGQLHRQNDRMVVCSPMSTLGKTNDEDDAAISIKYFHVPSWTPSDYLAAISNKSFYDVVKEKLDTQQVLEDELVNAYEEGDELLSLHEFKGVDESMRSALISKFYYAGGSCRYMFQYSTLEVIEKLNKALESTKNKVELIHFSSGELHKDNINRLYGMSSSGRRIAVSAYVTMLITRECGPEVIAALALQLNTSNNPSLDGQIFEWLFFAWIRNEEKLEVFVKFGAVERLPSAEVLNFDPKRKFKKIWRDDEKFDLVLNKFWLKPIQWNQGGYDAVYIDSIERKVIFVQVTVSHQHAFKMRYFSEVLENLEPTPTTRSKSAPQWNVVVYFLVKQMQLVRFTISQVEDRDHLFRFDPAWTNPEEDHVKICALKGSNRNF